MAIKKAKKEIIKQAKSGLKRKKPPRFFLREKEEDKLNRLPSDRTFLEATLRNEALRAEEDPYFSHIKETGESLLLEVLVVLAMLKQFR